MTTTNTGTPRPSNPQPGPRSLRTLWRTLVIAGFAATMLGGVAASPAQAHVPIILLVMAPQDGQTVDANPQIVIYAQRTLGGVDQVAYTLTLDQHPIDAASGQLGSNRPAQIRAGQQTHVPLRDLTPGQHRLAIRYRPDKDEPVMGDTVSFTVRPPATRLQPVVPVAVGVGLALATAAGVTGWRARRRRRRGAGRPGHEAGDGATGEQEPKVAEQTDLHS